MRRVRSKQMVVSMVRVFVIIDEFDPARQSRIVQCLNAGATLAATGSMADDALDAAKKAVAPSAGGAAPRRGASPLSAARRRRRRRPPRTPPGGSWPARGAERRDRVGLAARLQAGHQVAEPLRAADPGRRHERGQPQQSAQSASHVARSREVSTRGSPAAPSSALTSGFVRFRRPGSASSQTRPAPADPAAASGRAW
jgi:hypothetical protein